MKSHELLYHIGILMLIAKLPNVTKGDDSIAESVTCRSTQWLQWRVVLEGSLAVSDITMEYLTSDPVGHTRVAAESGLNFTFNLIVNNQSQLVSIMTVTGLIDTNINVTVHCGQEIHHLSLTTVQGELEWLYT